jgi:hypothetical protein
LETSALFLPAVGLLGLTAVNAGTGWLEQTDALDALGLGIALAGVLVLVGLAIYGLATLLASEDSSQRSAWLTVAMAVGLLVAVVPTREVAALQATAAFAAAPIVALAAIAAARIGRRIDPAEPAYAIPVVATLAQIGLL